MMTELKPFIQSDDKQVAYYGYKAGAWLDYAYSEDVEGSLSKAGEFALAEGLSIKMNVWDKSYFANVIYF